MSKMADEKGGFQDKQNQRSAVGTSVPVEKPANKFVNDGSFLELFRKKMEEGKSQQGTKESPSSSRPSKDEQSSSQTSDVQNVLNSRGKDDDEKTHSCTVPQKKSSYLPFVGKRRGNTPSLKTGTVKKTKKDDQEKAEPTGKRDAWSEYMAEVKKYKARSCQDEDKNRPLVK